MKWLFKIFLAFNVLLLCGGDPTGAQPFIKSRFIPAFLVEHAKPHFEVDKNETKVSQLAGPNELSKLTAPEFEEESVESGGAKKQIVKANFADIFLTGTGWIVSHHSQAVNNNLPPGELPLALTANKIYLAIQVFRL